MAITGTRTASASGAAGSTNVQLTFGSAPPQDSLLVAHVSGSASHTVGSGWSQVGSSLVDVDTFSIFVKLCGAGESTTQTPCTTAGNWSLAMLEAAGTDTNISTVFGEGTQNTDSDATKTTTGTCDPPDGVERLVVGGAFTDGNRTWSGHVINGSATGVTVQDGAGAGTAAAGTICTLFYRLDSATVSGNYTAEAVASAADNGGACITTWEPAAAPAGDAVPVAWAQYRARRV